MIAQGDERLMIQFMIYPFKEILWRGVRVSQNNQVIIAEYEERQRQHRREMEASKNKK